MLDRAARSSESRHVVASRPAHRCATSPRDRSGDPRDWAPYNAEPPLAALAGQPVTATDTFYSRNHGPVPDIDPDAWRLVVDGLVHTPLELSLADLAARFAERTLSATLQCAGNRRSGLIAVRDIPGEGLTNT